MTVGEDLLLLRAVDEPARRALVLGMLDDGMGGRDWHRGADTDLWELHDASFGSEEEPVAAAGTCLLGDGRRVRLVALVVAGGHRGAGVGRRMIEELSDALRARGVLSLVAAVPSHLAPAIVALQRGGLRPSHVERAGPGAGGHDLVWFDVEL